MTAPVDVNALDVGGPSGAVWALPAGGDLNANVVVVQAGDVMPAHVNQEVDVLLVVLSGGGVARIDEAEHPLRANTIVLVPKRSVREVHADPGASLVYVTVHRARAGLGIGAPR